MKKSFADRNRNRNRMGKRNYNARPATLEKRIQNKPSNAFRIDGPLAIIRPNKQWERMAS